MIMGMGLHDRGYGYLDNSPIGCMRDEEWEVIARRGFEMECSDVVADTVIKYHFRRLASHGSSEIRKSFLEVISKMVNWRSNPSWERANGTYRRTMGSCRTFVT
ncbi:MAG: hypothetical protein Fur0017_26230 [Anaerolineales bacterium]